jgi:UDP-N-acetylglucosamine 4,6-dehydratase
MEIEKLFKRKSLFNLREKKLNTKISNKIKKSSFLVIGGAGTIGQATVKEIFIRNPKKLHVVDINENNLVELVRDIRSSVGYINGDFRTFVIDCGSSLFKTFFKNEGPYDYVLNLSALKHVRSERDIYSLIRMISTNVLNTEKIIDLSINSKVKNFFSVSTDKASNPINLMGCSKLLMEYMLQFNSKKINFSSARFANVAFSDGSLLHGFKERFDKKQPLAAPKDISRYFISKKESGVLCLLSCLLGKPGDIFFPDIEKKLKAIFLHEIAVKFLKHKGFKAVVCKTENDARKTFNNLFKKKEWPCFFFNSISTGEKKIEIFFSDSEIKKKSNLQNIGIVKSIIDIDKVKTLNILKFLKNKRFTNAQIKKNDLIKFFKKNLKNFEHDELNKNLDEKM